MTITRHLSLDSMRPTAIQSGASITTRLRGMGRDVRALESMGAYWSVADSKQDQTSERTGAGIVKRGRTL
jgi:hypothetical protein